MAGAAPVAGSLAALRALGGQSAMLSAPAAAPVASKNMEEAKIRAKYLFREVRGETAWTRKTIKNIARSFSLREEKGREQHG